jgi:transposase
MEDELAAVARDEPVIQALLQIPGFGILTATAVFATVADIHASATVASSPAGSGLTPREFSSGSRRRLGRISKQGDPYVRMLLIHGARSALNAARRAAQADKPLTQLQAWALAACR